MGINRKLDALVAVEVMGLSPRAVHCWPRTKDEAWTALQKGELHTPLEIYEDVSGISWHCNRYGCDCSVYEGHPVPICLASVPLYSINIADAWDVQKRILGENVFSVRRGYYKALQETISKRVAISNGSEKVIIVWPDALAWLEPVDICNAALETVRTIETIDPYAPRRESD